MSEEITFNRLKRTPFHKMKDILDDGLTVNTPIPPVYMIGTREISRSNYYDNAMLRHHQLEKLLTENGWTIIDFIKETEKAAIKEQIDIVNQEFNLPKEVIERARELFPNLTYTPAKLELNDE